MLHIGAYSRSVGGYLVVFHVIVVEMDVEPLGRAEPGQQEAIIVLRGQPRGGVLVGLMGVVVPAALMGGSHNYLDGRSVEFLGALASVTGCELGIRSGEELQCLSNPLLYGGVLQDSNM